MNPTNYKTENNKRNNPNKIRGRFPVKYAFNSGSTEVSLFTLFFFSFAEGSSLNVLAIKMDIIPRKFSIQNWVFYAKVCHKPDKVY